MTMPEWWKQNEKYVKAWALHSVAMILVGLGMRYVSTIFFPPDSSPGLTPATISFVAASFLVILAVSLFLFRAFVMRFVVMRESWAVSVPHHPFRPYAIGWLSYVIVSIVVFALTGIFLGALFAVFPWGAYVFRGGIAFFVFRMAVRKHVLPHGMSRITIPEQEGTEHPPGA